MSSLPPDLIDEVVRRVLTVVQPDRIILFGSAAAGEMTPDSDVDLLVLRKTPGNARKESVQIRRALRDLGLPFDVIVMDTELFQRTKEIIGGLAHPANESGKVIYAAA
jgi:predicted nucleotidyltransferase